MKYMANHVVIPGLKSLPRTSSGGNLLSFWMILPLAAVVLFLAACSDDNKTAGGTEEDAGIVAIEDKTISGVSQKGPFVNGSSVTVYGLDGETLAQTGNIYEGKIKSDMGDFSVKVVKLASQYALLKANGFYRNEVTGEKSNSQMTLYALTDLSDRDEVNVNLLTHLAYERSLYLATNSMSVVNAKKQAEAEVFKSFEIEGDFGVAEDLNIFGENDQSAALLAISVLMQGDLKEADFSERLDNYARDIEADGVWDDKKTATAIADWASSISLNGKIADIRGNIIKWQLSSDIPAFEKYVDNFWWQNYGLGICDKEHQSDVKTNSNALSVSNGIHFICDNKAWRLATDLEKDTYKWEDGDDADIKLGDVIKSNCYVFEDRSWRAGSANDCSLGLRGCTALRQDTVGLGADKVWHICDTKQWRNATNIEKDTATWGAGKFDGEVRVGQVNTSIYYIYGISNDVWRNATTLEKDTYDYTNNKDWIAGTDGEIKKGSVTDSMYVYDASAWRTADEVEKALGGCVTAIADSVGKVGSTYYICTPRKWVVATVLQYDTYKKECLIDGSIVDGNVISSNKYVCDDGAFRFASENDIRAGLGCTSYTRGEYRILSGQYSYYKCETDGWLFTTERLNQGTMTDERDGHVYKTIGIKTQMWMAENLNYADSANYPSMLERNWCYDDEQDNCRLYGRLYTWSAAIDSVFWFKQGKICGYEEPVCGLEKIRGICPEGWLLPTEQDWDILYNNIGRNIKAMQAKGYESWKKTTDEFGFAALPAGGKYGDYQDNGNSAIFWSSKEYGASSAIEWCLGSSEAYSCYNGMGMGASVRCVKN